MESGRFLPIKIGEGGFYFGKDDLFFLLRNYLPDMAAAGSAFPIKIGERRHSSEGVRGARVLGQWFSWAFLGRLSFGPGPSVLGPVEF